MRSGYRLAGRHLDVSTQRQAPGRFVVSIDGIERTVEAALVDRVTLQLSINGNIVVAYVLSIVGLVHVWLGGEVYVLTPEVTGASAQQYKPLAPPQILAPMPGRILQVLVEPGQHVAEGDGLLILEAMKMEHRIAAAAAAVVRAVHVTAGQMVDDGSPLLELEYDLVGENGR
jgi:acetyl/propionyl-CoA carboxylase alpha subunit